MSVIGERRVFEKDGVCEPSGIDDDENCLYFEDGAHVRATDLAHGLYGEKFRVRIRVEWERVA
jgi:hypothetical protein